jgi:hypothetical protein
MFWYTYQIDNILSSTVEKEFVLYKTAQDMEIALANQKGLLTGLPKAHFVQPTRHGELYTVRFLGFLCNQCHIARLLLELVGDSETDIQRTSPVSALIRMAGINENRCGAKACAV